MAEQLTILTSRGRRLTKLFKANGQVEGYEDAKTFSVHTQDVASLEDILEVLRQLDDQPNKCIIRGKLRPGANPRKAYRRSRQRPGHPEPCFEEEPRRWLCVDVDGLLLPKAVWADPWLQAEALRDRLPEELQDAGMVIQWSSSHGTYNAKGRCACAHVWLWLSSPLSSSAARALAREWEADGRPWLDPSVCKTVQPHYTAAPLYEDPALSPAHLQNRLCLLTGGPLDLSEAQERWDEAVGARLQRAQTVVITDLEGDLAIAAAILENITADVEGYDERVAVGMALHSRFEGDPRALELWDQWCARWSGYEAGICDYKWSTFTPGSGLGFGTLVELSRKYGYEPPISEDRIPDGPETRVDEPGEFDPGEPPEWLHDAPGGSPPAGEPAGDGAEDEEEIIIRESQTCWWTFGRDVKRTLVKTTKDGEYEEDTRLGWCVWPEAICRDPDGEGWAVLYRYQDRAGQMRRAFISAASFASSSKAETAASQAMNLGVRVAPGRAGLFGRALGNYYMRGQNLARRLTTSSCGWHDDNRVFAVGDEAIYSAKGAEAWVWRGKRGHGKARGELERWKRDVQRMILVGDWSSKAMAMAVAVAFGGSFIEPLGADSTMVHFYGTSSAGKTASTYLAASVWSDPGQLTSWLDTANQIGGYMPAWSGKSLVIDDIRKAQDKGKSAVAALILSLSDNATKGRMQRDSTLGDKLHFALTLISSGEQSMASYLGEGEAQGGHTVRAIDLRLMPGETTHSATHARKLERWCRRAPYGVAGRAWAQALVERMDGQSWDELEEVIEAYVADAEVQQAVGASGENARIAYIVALCCVALETAQGWDICPDLGLSPLELMRWATRRICEDRGKLTTNEERTLQALVDDVQRNPGRYPTYKEASDMVLRDLGGVQDPDEGLLYATEGQVKPLCSRLRMQVRVWLAWLVSQDLAREPSKEPERIHSDRKLRGRWYRINLTACERRLA